MVLYLVRRSKIFVSVATLKIDIFSDILEYGVLSHLEAVAALKVPLGAEGGAALPAAEPGHDPRPPLANTLALKI